MHKYDDGLLSAYDQIADSTAKNRGNLYIFHLLGQHVAYRDRYPHKRTHFYASDYEERRPELSAKQRKMVSYYDNAVLYNDSIVDAICHRFDNQDAIVIYMPDHGEECYEETVASSAATIQPKSTTDWPSMSLRYPSGFTAPIVMPCVIHRYSSR